MSKLNTVFFLKNIWINFHWNEIGFHNKYWTCLNSYEVIKHFSSSLLNILWLARVHVRENNLAALKKLKLIRKSIFCFSFPNSRNFVIIWNWRSSDFLWFSRKKAICGHNSVSYLSQFVQPLINHKSSW